jgi:hypothetical protein
LIHVLDFKNLEATSTTSSVINFNMKINHFSIFKNGIKIKIIKDVKPETIISGPKPIFAYK